MQTQTMDLFLAPIACSQRHMDKMTAYPTSRLFIEALGASGALLAAWHLPIACAPVADVVVLKVPDLKGTAVDHCKG